MSRHLTENLKGTAREAASLAPLSMAEEVNTMSPRRMIAAMFRQSRLIIGLTFVGIAITAFIALSTPNTYRSQGTFLYTTGSESVRLDPLMGGSTDGEAILGNASYVFQADGLLNLVIDQPGMMQKLLDPKETVDNAFLKLWGSASKEIDYESEEARDAALKVLKSSLELIKPRNTDVLELAYTARSANLAREILNVYMDQAVKWHLNVYNDEKRLKAVEDSAEKVEERLKAAVTKYSEFLQELKVYDFTNSLARMQEDVALKKSALDAVEQDISRLTAFLAYIRGKLGAEEQYIEIVRMVDMPDPQLALLKNKIEEQKLVLTEMEARGKKGQPLETERDVLVEFEKRYAVLAAIPTELDEQRTTEENVVYTGLVADEARVERELQEATLRRGIVRESYDAASAELLALESRAADHQALRAAVTHLTAENESSDLQLSQALRKKELAAGAFSSLQEIDRASKPLEKAGPNRTKLVLMGFFGGLFAALAIVLLRTLGDTTVRGRDDLDRISGIAVLGTFPRLDGRNVRRHRSLREQTL